MNVTAVDPERITTLIRFWHRPGAGKMVTSEVIQAIATNSHTAVSAVAPVPDTPLTPPAAV